MFRSARRKFLVAMGTTLLGLKVKPVAAALTTNPPPEISSLLQRRAELLDESKRLDDRWATANRLLPRWCRSGRKYRDYSGAEVGPIVGWPATDDDEGIMLADGNRLVRPSPQDLRDNLKSEIDSIGYGVAIDGYRRRILYLRSRLAMRRQLASNLGMPRTRDWIRIDEEIEMIEMQLDAVREV